MTTGLVAFSGYTETNSRPSGTQDLWALLAALYGDDFRLLGLKQWDHPTQELAAECEALGLSRVAVVGYSWGGGFAAQNFAKRLWRYGITVPIMLLCDPVYRPLWLPVVFGPSPLAFQALIRQGACIKVPGNVNLIRGVRQDATTPRGHELHLPNGNHLVLPLIFGETHATIDSSPVWHRLVVRELDALRAASGT